MLLRSPRLAAVPGVAHGFGTRLGGWSTGPFATLHMGLSVGGPEPDGPAADAAVAANRRRFARALGGEALVLVDQVHGARVVAAEDAAGAQADGLLATTPGRVVGGPHRGLRPDPGGSARRRGAGPGGGGAARGGGAGPAAGWCGPGWTRSAASATTRPR